MFPIANMPIAGVIPRFATDQHMLRIPKQLLNTEFHKRRIEPVIVRQPHKEFTAGSLDDIDEILTAAHIRGLAKTGHARISLTIFFAEALRLISRGIVENHNLKIAIGLLECRIYGPGQQMRPVEGRNADGYEWFRGVNFSVHSSGFSPGGGVQVFRYLVFGIGYQVCDSK
jgi:hypothetical protein